MRILHVMNSLSNRGNGIVNLAVDLGIEQQANGHDVAFATGGGGYEELLRSFGIKHYLVEQSGGARKIPRAAVNFRKATHQFNPDLVHAHMRTGVLVGWFWSRFTRVPLVAHLHNVHDRESRLMGLADRVIAVSESVSRSMQQSGISAKKLRVVVNGTLNSRRFPSLKSIRPRELARPAIVTVAGMNHRKGIAELLTAFEMIGAEFPESHLYLVGDGPERLLFEQQASASSFHSRIHFEGFQQDPQAYMLSSDLFVLASRRDSCPLVLAEARQASCAIIASDVDGIPEALDFGKAGVLVEPNNPAAFAAAMRELLGNDDVREQWKRRGSERISSLTTARMAEEVDSIYRELMPQATQVAAAD